MFALLLCALHTPSNVLLIVSTTKSRMAPYFQCIKHVQVPYAWRVIFVGSNVRGESEKALKIIDIIDYVNVVYNIYVKINFRVFKAISLGAWHCCISDDVIDTRARDLPIETWTKGMR